MATGEVFIAINPDPTKQSARLERTKYDLMRAIILGNLQAYGSMTSRQLGDLIEEQAQNDFDGSVKWYFKIVKNDLEARGEIRRVLKFKSKLPELSDRMWVTSIRECLCTL
jgi:hypothetical protein